MNHPIRLALFAANLVFMIPAIAQDASDVEAKAYGSYSGGKFDTVDLSTGNLFIDIPLLSYQQRGKLPPLTFGIGLNNAPYTRLVLCSPDPDSSAEPCQTSYYRYDTSPPGASPTYGVRDPVAWGVPTISGKIGAYITSSYEGAIVTGTSSGLPWEMSSAGVSVGASQLLYSLIDSAGTTHALESGADNLNIYHAQDGSGWTFLPSGPGNAYDLFDPDNGRASNWISSLAQTSSLRLGTVLSPAGIHYSYQFLPEPQLTSTYTTGTGGTSSVLTSLVASTATDSLGNTVTRGPWYWTGSGADAQAFYSSPSNRPLYIDSIGRQIPDIVSLQETVQGPANAAAGSCPVGSTGLVWNPPGPGGSTLSYTFCYTYMTLTLAFGADSGQQQTLPESGSMNVLTSIILPNQTQWTFTYDPQTTNLLRVGLPTGGNISYTYQVVSDNRCMQNPCEAVNTRTEDDGLGHVSTTRYAFGYIDSVSSVPYYTTTETDSMQNDTVHTFTLIGSGPGSFRSSQLYETKTVYYQGPSTTASGLVLKGVSTDYQYQWDFTGAGAAFRAIQIFPTKITTTTANGYQTITTRKYSSDGGSPLFNARRIICSSSSTVFYGDNPSSCQDVLASSYYPSNSYGVSSNSPSVSYQEPTSETLSTFATRALRTTTRTFQFQIDARYKAANMISLPQSVQIQDNGVYNLISPPLTITTYNYDEVNHGPQGVLGNLTSTSTLSYMSGAGSSTFAVSTGSIYNATGMPTAQIDANGNTTSISYDSTGLFVSSVQRPTTNGVGHTDYYSNDANLGYMNWHTDENGASAADINHTTVYTHDVMGRVTGIQYPGGGGSVFCYTDTGGQLCSKSGPPYKLYASTSASPDPAVTTIHTYDGLGRPVQSSVASDSLGADLVDTTYDSEGRVHSISNPYRATSGTTDPTVGITSYNYDALGRKTSQTQPDGSRQQWCYDGVATNGQTNCSKLMAKTLGINATEWTDVSDELGKHTQHITNALGQIVGVMEPSPGTGALSLETDYFNDAFGDLITVNQLGSPGNASRTRWFSYYAPSLVQRACNPETLAPGQTCGYGNVNGVWYVYDPAGNVRQKTDNRGVSVNYTYDLLNRLLSKSSSDQATPSSCYQYDLVGAANSGIGRLASAWTQSASAGPCSASAAFWSRRSILAYDPMGRVLNEQQCTPSNCTVGTPYSSSYSYNLAGKVSTYTSGITVVPGVGSLQLTNAYDAVGRLQTLSSNWNNGTHPGTIFSAQAGTFTSCSNSTVPYSPSGGLINATLGTGLTLNRTFDNRLRTTCEVDSGYGGNQPATSGFGVVRITGQEQGK